MSSRIEFACSVILIYLSNAAGIAKICLNANGRRFEGTSTGCGERCSRHVSSQEGDSGYSGNARAKASESLVEATALSAVDLFKDLPVACLRMLEEGSGLRDFRKGHIFFRAGESGERLFLVENGRVQTYRTSGTRKLIIAELKPPAVFGEMGCVGQRMYHCSAQTTEPSRIRVLERSDLEAYSNNTRSSRAACSI